MTRTAECQFPFRLTRDHNGMLEKACSYLGQTKQAFIHAAVMSSVADVLDQRRLKHVIAPQVTYKVRLDRHKEEKASGETQQQAGTGLSDNLLRARNPEPPPPPLNPQQQGQVVVNVGSAQGTGSAAVATDTIDRLAAYVVAGGDFERDTRLRNTVMILQASTENDEERRVLAARLDEAVAVKIKQREENGGAWKAARVMFDKVADILKGT